jgi:hypothetical protein
MTDTYNTLVSAIMDASEEDGSEFVAYIPTMINLAELRLTTDLDAYGQTVITTIATTSADPMVSLPAGTRIVKSIAYVNDNGRYTNLLMRTNEFLRDYWPVRTSTATSTSYYARWGATQIMLAPTPTSAISLEMELVVRPSALGLGQQTNWYTQYADDALFYASMIEASSFMKDPQMLGVWKEQYSDAIARLKNEARRTRRDDQNEVGTVEEDNLNG